MVVKKGQVTIFIIIGIILLFAVGVGIYVYNQKVIKPIEQVAIPTVEKAPAEVLPIQEYLTGCVESTAKVALRRIGDYGGYLDVSQLSYNPIMPTSGEAVQFSPGSSFVIPFWWHLKSPNDCTGKCEFSSKRPFLYKSEGSPSIEEQLNEYIKANLRECFAGFEQFKSQGFEIKEIEDIKVESVIAKENIVIKVKYPLQIQKGDKTFNLNEYVAALDLSLGNIYDLATQIVNTESKSKILEGFTREMISIFSSLDSKGIPPMYDIDIKFGGGTVWTKYEIGQRMQEIITSYVPMLQVGNTRYYRYKWSPETQEEGGSVRDPKLFEALYNRGLLFDISEKTFPDIGVRFTYLPWWPIYFDLNCNGQACSAESISSTDWIVFGVQRYSFAYDISYPVLVELYDPTAFKNEGYSFKFFIEANMRNNLPLETDFNPMETYKIQTASMLCDVNQRTSGDITIKVLDSRTGKGIDKASVGYTCGSESCPVGETINGTLVAQLPRCLGGQLSAAHVDYQKKLYPFDVTDNRTDTVTIELDRFKPVNFEVKKWMLKKGVGWNLDTSNATEQDGDEDTLIILERIPGENDLDFSAFGEVCGRENFKTPAACGTPPEDISEGIKIIPGDYKVQIFSFKYPRPALVIPRDKRVIKLPWGTKDYYIPEEPIVFDEETPFPAGFADFNITITPEQLENANTIEFYYINFALHQVPESQRKIEDLEQIGKSIEYSQANRPLLEPKYYYKR